MCTVTLYGRTTGTGPRMTVQVPVYTFLNGKNCKLRIVCSSTSNKPERICSQPKNSNYSRQFCLTAKLKFYYKGLIYQSLFVQV